MEATTGTPLLIGGNRAKALRLYSFPERKPVRYVILCELKVADFLVCTVHKGAGSAVNSN
jgi:hypothetical protein